MHRVCSETVPHLILHFSTSVSLWNSFDWHFWQIPGVAKVLGHRLRNVQSTYTLVNMDEAKYYPQGDFFCFISFCLALTLRIILATIH